MGRIQNLTNLAILLLLGKCAICSEPGAKETQTISEKGEVLTESETKDGKLEIIKRIKKVNDDGSYTIGYEADDGSFKIESRDVLGNVKGTYGFLDDAGKIKRVSYSTSNSSEILSKPSEANVVQTIPAKSINDKDKITSVTTRKPVSSYSSTTPTPSTSSSFVQSIPKRRATSAVSTTQRSNYNNVITINPVKNTEKPNATIYTSAAPRVLLQRPSLATTAASNTHLHTVKSEGVLLRPEVSTASPNAIPIFERLTLHRLENTKPVSEEPEASSNILRRELSPEKLNGYNFQEQLYSFQQSLGSDATDVYNTGVAGTQRPPLFTTTLRPRLAPLISSTTARPIIAVPRPTVKYASSYARQDSEENTPEYAQETSSPEGTPSPTTVPISQIPANREQPEPLVAVRHPFHGGTILVPLSQIRGRVSPVESMRDIQEARRHFSEQYDGQQYRKTTQEPPVVEIERQKVRMLNLAGVRSLPVQVDHNGYVREMPRHYPPPYPMAVPNAPIPKQVIHEDVENDIDHIEPPVSVKDFQKLLQHLIMRQKKLETINALMNSRTGEQVNQIQPVRYRTVYHPTASPYIIQRIPVRTTTGPVQFTAPQEVVETQQRTPGRQFIAVPSQEHHDAIIRQQLQRQRYYSTEFEQQQPSVANRRVARLQPPPQHLQETEEQQQEEYLPPEVREMLLLKMLQLAINPALPVGEDNEDQLQSIASTSVPQYKRAPVRNIEILGEEPETPTPRRMARTKRYKEEDMDYFE